MDASPDCVLSSLNQNVANIAAMALASISHEDLRTLMANPSAEQRAEMTRRIAERYKEKHFRQEEFEQFRTILDLVSRDAERLVRHALSSVLHDCPDLPRVVAVRMIEDIDAIALPVLEKSLVLNDEDLLPIAIGSSAARQRAIAGRPLVSEDISHALILHGTSDVHTRLVQNHAALIAENGLDTLLGKYPQDDPMHRLLAVRPALPPRFVEKMLDVVADNLKEYLFTHTQVAPDVVRRVIARTQEKMTVASSTHPGTSDLEIRQLVTHLHQQQRLTDSIIARALCSGNVRFFENALSSRASLPVLSVHKILAGGSEESFRALCQKSGIPANWTRFLRMTYAQHAMTAAATGSSLYHQAGRNNMLETLLTTEQFLPEELAEYVLKTRLRITQTG